MVIIIDTKVMFSFRVQNVQINEIKINNSEAISWFKILYKVERFSYL